MFSPTCAAIRARPSTNTLAWSWKASASRCCPRASGIPHTISQTLAELNLDISAARIVTERGAAIDSFYVRDADDGSKILEPGRLKEISGKLLGAIARLDVAA